MLRRPTSPGRASIAGWRAMPAAKKASGAQAGHVADSNTSRQYTANTVNNPLERPLKRLKKDADGGLVVLPDA